MTTTMIPLWSLILTITMALVVIMLIWLYFREKIRTRNDIIKDLFAEVNRNNNNLILDLDEYTDNDSKNYLN